MRQAIAVSGSYPCVRAGKMTEAMSPAWEHSCVSRGYPPQFSHVYTSVRALRSCTRAELVSEVLRTPGEIIHVHNEPNWPVADIKERDPRPLVLNVHDIASARPFNREDSNRLGEAEAYEAADALVFISESQRDFAIKCGFAVQGKPYAIMANWASASITVNKPLMPHIGGMVYAGGLDPRGMRGAWRDLSAIADAVEEFHVYPGGPGIDYGIVHMTVLDYPLLTQFMARHDWGFTGTPNPMAAWSHSVPNKLFEYLAAGIPFVALNNPLCNEYAEMGLGLVAESVRDVKKVLNIDRRPFVKRIKAENYRLTMRYNIQPLLDLFDEVAG